MRMDDCLAIFDVFYEFDKSFTTLIFSNRSMDRQTGDEVTPIISCFFVANVTKMALYQLSRCSFEAHQRQVNVGPPAAW